jgi:calcineurin-like phosphoesterase family protein
MSDWFSSDTHFLHKLVAGLRGFTTVNDNGETVPDPVRHDEAIIRNWNRLVKPDDTAWLLGDVGLGNEDRILAQAARLNGRKQLIAGNHDRVHPGNPGAHLHQKKWLEVFKSVQAFARVRVGDQVVLLSHFPYDGDHTEHDRATQFRLRDEGVWLLHGHTHSAERYEWPDKSIHVGLDAWELKPVPAHEIDKIITAATARD